MHGSASHARWVSHAWMGSVRCHSARYVYFQLLHWALSPCSGYAVAVLRLCCGYAVAVLWLCCGCAVAVLWLCCGRGALLDPPNEDVVLGRGLLGPELAADGAVASLRRNREPVGVHQPLGRCRLRRGVTRYMRDSERESEVGNQR